MIEEKLIKRGSKGKILKRSGAIRFKLRWIEQSSVPVPDAKLLESATSSVQNVHEPNLTPLGAAEVIEAVNTAIDASDFSDLNDIWQLLAKNVGSFVTIINAISVVRLL
jgi:hypothetical protein